MKHTSLSLLLWTLLFFGSHLAAEMPPATLEKLQKEITFSSTGPNRIGYIEVANRDGMISESTFFYIKLALDHYRQEKPICIVLRLNTPGGEVFAAEKISDQLRDIDLKDQIPVIAFVDNWAVSAGAMLAYSCRFITAVPDAVMGAAEPVTASKEGTMESASEKVNSVLRTDFRNRALFYGRDPIIAMAMVDKDMIVVERDGKIIQLDSEDQIIHSGSTPDKVISPKGKLLTLDGKELMQYKVADFLVPFESGTSLGDTPISALLRQPFFKDIPNVVVDQYKMDWKGYFLAFLMSPQVASLLVMGMMLGFYMELSSPGFGLPAVLALTCLLLILLSSVAMEAINWLEIVFIAVGVIIIVVDLFFLPTFGLMGAVGVVLLLAGVVGLLVPGLESISYDTGTATWNAAGQAALERLAWILGAFGVSLLFALLFTFYLAPKWGIFRRFISQGEQEASQGYQASFYEKDLVGREGTVVSDLKPAGHIDIDGKLYQAISRGDYIDAGERVEVIEGHGAALVVKRKKS